MPLLVLCGYPCSGKSTRAEQIKKYFETERQIKSLIISEHNRDLHRNELYNGWYKILLLDFQGFDNFVVIFRAIGVAV